MQDLAIRTYVALENLQFRVQTLADEDGQTAAEYVGILAFVAAVLGIVIAAGSGIGSAIVTRITTLINSL
jgi:Flp pilus assembly pilin Flp